MNMSGSVGRTIRPIMMVIVALTTFASILLAGAESAQAATTGTASADPCLTLRDAGSASGSNLGCIPNGTTITIDCTISGDTESGPWGDSTVWDHTTYGGANGYVTDALVYTGTSAPVAPTCGGAPPASREQDAVNWLNAQAGSTGYDELCETMVENAYGVSGKYSTALDDFQAQQSAGAIHTDTNAPAGALVFFAGNSSAGHVEIANGDGQYWDSDGTVHLVDLAYGGEYYGWSYAPGDWTGV